MKIYSFWSGDTTYITKSKSLKKAQKVGQENMIIYLDLCKEENEEPEADTGYFIPESVAEENNIEYVKMLVKTNNDVLVLDDEIEMFLMT
jgi:hypothetical protein